MRPLLLTLLAAPLFTLLPRLEGSGIASAAAAPPAAAPPQAEPLTAAASCPRRASRGRVLCEVEVEVDEGRIAWADLLVRRAPRHAPPLRARIGPGDATLRTDRRVRLPLALVATGAGTGLLHLEARAVVCRGEPERELCVPRVQAVKAEVGVGPVDERG